MYINIYIYIIYILHIFIYFCSNLNHDNTIGPIFCRPLPPWTEWDRMVAFAFGRIWVVCDEAALENNVSLVFKARISEDLWLMINEAETTHTSPDFWWNGWKPYGKGWSTIYGCVFVSV